MEKCCLLNWLLYWLQDPADFFFHPGLALDCNYMQTSVINIDFTANYAQQPRVDYCAIY